MKGRPNAELSRSLETIDRLTQRDEKMNEFFMAASHQLKSPVAIMQWCLQTILESGAIDAKSRDLVLKTVNQAGIMNQLITDMLHVFRLTYRQEEKAQYYSFVDINATLVEVFAQYEVVAHQRHVHLVKGPSEVLPPVYVEESFLKQAMINLVDNAIKYSDSGDEVTVSTHLAKDNFAEIIVEDQGIGIPEAEQSQLFKEFFRGEEAQARTYEGTGLGLVLVKHVAEEFGGSIVVHSTLHKGSRFILRLPTAEVSEKMPLIPGRKIGKE